MVWKKVVHLPLQFYESNNPKELLSRITTDVTSISTLIMQVLLPVFTTAYSSLLMLGRVSSYDQRLMWALVIVLPVNILISFVLGRMRFGVADLINRRNATADRGHRGTGQQYAADQVDGHRGKKKRSPAKHG